MTVRKVYANKHHVVSLPTKHVLAVIKVLEQDENVDRLSDEECEALDQVLQVLRIEAESAELDMSVRCDQCGRQTGMDTGVCGMCAEDFNSDPPRLGRVRINRRRMANGLEPINWSKP